MAKGSDYERAVCVALSEWWTGDRRDDVLWRSQNSGARATQRGKAGLVLPGQYGDIAATDPVALPLTQLCVWELKRGYSTRSPFDCFDRSPGNAQQTWEGFFEKTIRSQQKAGAWSWAVISRRNLKESFICLSANLAKELHLCGAWQGAKPWPRVDLSLTVRNKKKTEELTARIACMLLRDFIAGVKPSQWVEVWRAYGHKE